MNRWTIAGGAALLIAIGGAAVALQNNTADPVSTDAPRETPSPTPAPAPKAAPSQAVDEAPVAAKETPMNQRVAVLGLLNKRNGVSRDLTLKPGQAVRVGDVIVRLRACETTAPWEVEKLTGAFVQVDVLGFDKQWRRVFSGWLYKESPSLNVVEHPIYDVWPKSCAMTRPEIGPDTVRVSSSSSSAGTPAKRSSAPNSAPTPTPSPSPSPSASPSNPT
jgi:hypothetical protein